MRNTVLAVLTLVYSSTIRASQVPLSAPSGLNDATFTLNPDSNPIFNAQSDFSETIVSILSESTQHTTLIHLLQRSKCIPMLAHIGSGTIFAPTDKAWEDWAGANRPSEDGVYAGWLSAEGLEEWMKSEQEVVESRLIQQGSDDDDALARDLERVQEELDNQNWALRQHLLYHMLNYTLSPSDLLAAEAGSNITTLTTLLHPILEEPNHPRVPEPGAPWLPRGGEGMLGGHGQRLRYARAGSEEGGERGAVGGDWKGKGGVAIWDGKGWKGGNGGNSTDHVGFGKDKRNVTGVRWGTNGAVIGVEGVLNTPPSIEEIIRTNPSLSYLNRLVPSSETLPSPLPANLTRAEHVTLFAPSNEAFEAAFDEVERKYLEGDFGAEGVARVVGSGVVMDVKKGEVGWRDYWSKNGDQVGAVSGDTLEIEAPPNGSLVVNGTEALVADIFASNGVIHIMPSLLVPDNFTLLNSAEKVLLSHNATRFVSLLRTANLSMMYAGEKGTAADQPWTILAPTDEVLNAMDRWGGGGPPLPDLAVVQNEAWTGKDDTPLAALLRYHVLPGRLLPDEIHDGMLVGTELRPASLAGNRQRLRIDVSDRFERHRAEWDAVDAGEIHFDGASVLGKPVKSGKSVIYFISSLLSPPDDILQTAVSELSLSTFIAAVYAADLERTIKNTPATTFFIPRNRAFSSLGLTMRYLLSSDGKDELRKVVKYHAVNKIIYSDDIEEGRESYSTLEGGVIVLDRTKGKNYTLRLSSPNKWEGHDSGDALPANGEVRPAVITQTDALTSTGAIHIIDSVVMPADVSITIGKLVGGTKQRTMVDLMLRAGLGWILEGREPRSDELQRTQLVGTVRAWDNDTDSSSPDIDSLARSAYTILCPTDKAFSRINLTAFMEDEQAMIDLLKLHIIPTQPVTPRTEKTKMPASAPPDGSPLSLSDDLVFQTLLSSSSKYGDVAFRATGDNSFLVGIRNARSGTGNDFARLGESGRATVRWKKNTRLQDYRKDGKHHGNHGEGVEGGKGDVLWRGGMAIGGGVIMVDSVLIPYEPSFFSRWGWLILAMSGIGVIVLITVMTFVWWWMTRNKGEEEPEGYEPLEGEEEE